MTRRLIPYALAALALTAGFASLRQYNATWDEAVGDVFFGQRYLSYFTSFDQKYLDFGADPYPAGYKPDFRTVPFRYRPWEHYPVASTLATISSRLFSATGLLDPFDGYHAFNLLIGAAFLILFYRFVEKSAGALVAATGTLLLLLSPRIFGDMMANVKDFSEMVFFSVTAAAFTIAIERGNARLLLGSGVLLGIALGTKANALFLPPIVVLYLIGRGVPPAWRGRERLLIGSLSAAFAIGVAVFFAAWPYLWSNPYQTLRLNLRYIALRKGASASWTTSNPFVMIALTMPPAFLLAFVIGLIPLVRRLRARDPLGVLLATIVGVVCARLAVPAAVNFDGVRHFLELFPAIAAVGGLGVAYLAGKLKRAALQAGVVAAFVAPILVAEVRVHPFETAYWNIFAGGLEGAVRNDLPQAGDYWAGSYRFGLRWLNEHAEPNALLAVPIAEHAVRVVAPYRLRPDILLVHITTPSNPKVKQDVLARFYEASRTRPAYVMFILRHDWANEVVYDSIRSFQPVAVWKVEGVPVLAIYRVTRKR